MAKRIFVCLLIMAMAATAAIPVALAGEEQAKEQVLVYAGPGRDIRAVDPAFGVLVAEVFIIYPMFNALVRYPPGLEGDLESIEPDLAKSWDVSKDGTVWTFYLRKGVKFHKGFGEFTAEDVKFTFERMKVEGAPWAKDYKRVKEIEILDNYTVRFQLLQPDPYFLMKLANYHGGFIVSKKARQQLGKKFKTEPVGTGPFQVKEYRPKDRYILERFDDYWRGKAILEKVICPFMPDTASRTMALQKGEIHVTPGRNDEMWVRKLMKTSKLIIEPNLQLGVHGAIHFNMTRKPFDDIRVRKAMAYATDRDEFTKFFGPMISYPLYGHVPQYAFGALQDKDIPKELRYDYNPEKAKQLLKEAGYPNGFTIDVYITEFQPYLDAMTIVQEQWRRVGVDMRLKTVDHPTYHSNIRKDMNPVVWYYAARTPVAGEYLEQWYHSASIVGKKTAITNFSHYGDVDADGDGQVADNNIDEYIDKAWVEMDPKERKRLYFKAQIQLLKDLPALGVRMENHVLVRQPYIDLGYEAKKVMMYHYPITEKTRVMKH